MTTNEEIDATLQRAGIDINRLKGDFKRLFPDAAEILQDPRYRDHSRGKQIARTCLLGFKAGVATVFSLRLWEEVKR